MRMTLHLAIGSIVMAISPAPAMASQSAMSMVTFVFTMPNGAMLFSQAGGDRASLPACGAGNATRWAVDATTPAGQNKLALILTAKALGKAVQVFGTGACNAWGDTETVDYIVMNN